MKSVRMASHVYSIQKKKRHQKSLLCTMTRADMFARIWMFLHRATKWKCCCSGFSHDAVAYSTTKCVFPFNWSVFQNGLLSPTFSDKVQWSSAFEHEKRKVSTLWTFPCPRYRHGCHFPGAETLPSLSLRFLFHNKTIKLTKTRRECGGVTVQKHTWALVKLNHHRKNSGSSIVPAPTPLKHGRLNQWGVGGISQYQNSLIL